MNWRGARLNDLNRRRDVLLRDGGCCSRLLLDEERRLRDRLLGARLVGSRLLLPALLRPLFRTLIGFAIPVALTMTIAAAAPVLFAFLGRLLACVGQPAFRARLLRLLRLLRSRRPLLLVAIAARAGAIPLRSARLLARPSIAATVAPAMAITIAIGAAATAVFTVTRSLV